MRRFVAAFFLICLSAAADTTAILPFANASGNANLNWIGESIAETLDESLSGEGLLVVDREKRDEAYRRLALRLYANITRASVVKIGEQLDVDNILYGEFETQADSAAGGRSALHITLWVLDLKKLRQSPGFSEKGKLDDLSALQTHLAWQATRYLIPGSTVTEDEFRRRRNPVRVDAIESYIRGLQASSPDQRYRLFTQAVRLDPAYWQPAFHLGRLSFEKKEWRVAADWFERVPASAARRRAALFYLGLCRFQAADYAGAQSAFRQVLADIPLNEVHNNLGAALSRTSATAAVESFQRALDGDSSDPDYHFNLGYALWKTGSFQAAAERFRAVLERVPDDQDATLLLGKCLQQTGPRPGEQRTEALERLKYRYEETVYLQLKSMVER